MKHKVCVSARISACTIAAGAGCDGRRVASAWQNAEISAFFASACQAHDQCYDQNNTPSGHAACDEQFLVAMRASCDQMWPVSGPWDFFQLRNRRTCYSYAQLYYLGVRIGGLLYLRYPNPV